MGSPVLFRKLSTPPLVSMHFKTTSLVLVSDQTESVRKDNALLTKSVVERLSCLFVPHYCSFPLIGNANPQDIFFGKIKLLFFRLVNQFSETLLRHFPQVKGILLDKPLVSLY